MNDEMLKVAISYCVKKEWGYFDDLIYEIGNELVDNFCRTGLIRIGFTRNRKTWSITNLAEIYKRDLGF